MSSQPHLRGLPVVAPNSPPRCLIDSPNSSLSSGRKGSFTHSSCIRFHYAEYSVDLGGTDARSLYRRHLRLYLKMLHKDRSHGRYRVGSPGRLRGVCFLPASISRFISNETSVTEFAELFGIAHIFVENLILA